ncbi:MAG: hypothetical protein Q4E24_10865 [bacterium]|nr:hypothetical protein [bacterium]
MRGLHVYFCPLCGYYGYYQLPQNAVCPNCKAAMRMLPVNYTAFLDLDCKARDELIGQEMLRCSKPFVQRLIEPHKEYNSREQIGQLIKRISELEEENKKLSETVAWMHETIWQLLRQKKGLNSEELGIASAEAAATFHDEEHIEKTLPIK